MGRKTMLSVKMRDSDKALLKAMSESQAMSQAQVLEQALRHYAAHVAGGEASTWMPELTVTRVVPPMETFRATTEQAPLDFEAAA